MRIARADEREAVRVADTAGVELEAYPEGLSHVAAGGLRDRRLRAHLQRDREDLEVRELVVGRERGVHFRLALDLDDLVHGLVAHAPADVVGVEGAAVEGACAEHQPVARILVVRYRQAVDAGGALFLEPGPELLRVRRVETAERPLGHGVAAEDHVAMEVVAVDGAGPLVADQRGEGAGVVVTVGRGHDLLPDAGGHLRAHEFRDGLAAVQRSDHFRERGLCFARVGRHETRRQRQLRQRALRIGELRQHAHVFRMVRDRGEIERAVQPYRIACRVQRLLPLREAIGVVG